MSVVFKHGRTLYLAANIAFTIVMTAIGLIGDVDNPRLLYVLVLAALCTTPLLWMQAWNDRNTVLAAFCGAYFLYFGVADTALILNGGGESSIGILSRAELAILIGACCAIAGYRWVAGRAPMQPRSHTYDWPLRSVVIAGLVIWAVGSAAVWYWNVHVIVRRSVEIENTLTPLGTTLVMLGRMIQPLGVMLLAYALSVSRHRSLLTLLLAIVAAQIVFAFISDSKEVAMRAAIIIIMVKLLVEGRPPKTWIGAAVVFIVVGFPVFQAYRVEITEQRGATNAEAAANILHFISIAWDSRHKVNNTFYRGDSKAQNFIERASLKGSVELIVDRVGRDVDFQSGYTLSPVATAFIPRIVWSDKPTIPTGQLMNQQFRVSQQEDVYISPSHLGELYWNFGWGGVIVGMAFIGAIMGLVGVRCNLLEHRSVANLLLVAVTIYSLCLRFEGAIATEYTIWVRSVAAILLLQLTLSRHARSAVASTADPRSSVLSSSGVSASVFPNLMR